MKSIHSRPGTPISERTVHILQAAMNLMIVALFVLLVIASLRHFKMTGSIRSFGVLAANTLFLVLFLIRRPAKVESDSLALWLLAFAGTAAPLTLRPTVFPGLTGGSVLQVVGLSLLIAALLSLRRSFAVVPANRGIREGGLYRFVRHPVYMAELTLMLGVALSNPSARNAVIWVCLCIVQLARARAEEKLLSLDPVYMTYCKRVHYRLIPGLL